MALCTAIKQILSGLQYALLGCFGFIFQQEMHVSSFGSLVHGYSLERLSNYEPLAVCQALHTPHFKLSVECQFYINNRIVLLAIVLVGRE